jgi:hypothetical protein
VFLYLLALVFYLDFLLDIILWLTYYPPLLQLLCFWFDFISMVAFFYFWVMASGCGPLFVRHLLSSYIFYYFFGWNVFNCRRILDFLGWLWCCVFWGYLLVEFLSRACFHPLLYLKLIHIIVAFGLLGSSVRLVLCYFQAGFFSTWVGNCGEFWFCACLLSRSFWVSINGLLWRKFSLELYYLVRHFLVHEP